MAQNIRAIAARSGMNCPVPPNIFQTGETDRGLTQRIECKSSDGEKTWNLRMVMRPNGINQVETW
ncbi:hypothetical protein AC629_41215 [Bradyrhizobium sp. NAS80.1]|uniref:hypothetical protein n=1 Tax=Bradyrhizobium sp. NAS80.1 TaxID=1680159 RepID=UPI0009601FF8|nr:hypothetical protein [Bradyrhizobium sp. NAS80.1]OKO69441.1 hypothetical protein AC629_41215 [Bradyrhizobium sp. NAS80.1]